MTLWNGSCRHLNDVLMCVEVVCEVRVDRTDGRADQSLGDEEARIPGQTGAGPHSTCFLLQRPGKLKIKLARETAKEQL